MRSVRSIAILVTILSVSLAVGAAPREVQAAEDESTGKQVGLGLYQVGANVGYGVVKVGYAAVGTLVTPFAWAFSGGNKEVAQDVFYSAARGDYTLNREQILFREPVEFVGRAPGEYPPSDTDVAASGATGSAALVEEGF